MTDRDDDATGTPVRWLTLVLNLPVDDPAGRMKILRTLETLGAGVLRDGVYVLPESRDARRGFDRLVQGVERIGGRADLLTAETVDAAQTKRLRALFDRSARYSELVKTLDGMRAAYGVSDPTAISQVLAKLRRDFEQVRALDFFPSPLAPKADAMLAEGEAEVRKLMFPEQAASAAPVGDTRKSKRQYFRRAWATRRPLFVDRLASGWLIRRFIDAEATMVWLDKGAPCPATAVGFGFTGATFSNTRTRVTFQELVAQFRLGDNPALVRIGDLVHALVSGGTPAPEATGVETLLAGAKRRAANDDELFAESEKTFDLLYESYFEVPRRESDPAR
jgi:hypothetical protein